MGAVSQTHLNITAVSTVQKKGKILFFVCELLA